MLAQHGKESDETFALEKVHEFIEKSAFDDDLGAIEMEESVEADEEYLRINTELRLIRDGVKHDYAAETQIELDPLDESTRN